LENASRMSVVSTSLNQLTDPQPSRPLHPPAIGRSTRLQGCACRFSPSRKVAGSGIRIVTHRSRYEDKRNLQTHLDSASLALGTACSGLLMRLSMLDLVHAGGGTRPDAAHRLLLDTDEVVQVMICCMVRHDRIARIVHRFSEVTPYLCEVLRSRQED
jgi:hypothetical protein